MSFNGTEGAAISLTDAALLTKEYRDENPGAIKAYFMGKDILNSILAQSGCMGIRVYYGLKDDGMTMIPKLVFVGADAMENDMITGSGIVADMGEPCPIACSASNALNSST